MQLPSLPHCNVRWRSEIRRNSFFDTVARIRLESVIPTRQASCAEAIRYAYVRTQLKPFCVHEFIQRERGRFVANN